MSSLGRAMNRGSSEEEVAAQLGIGLVSMVLALTVITNNRIAAIMGITGGIMILQAIAGEQIMDGIGWFFSKIIDMGFIGRIVRLKKVEAFFTDPIEYPEELRQRLLDTNVISESDLFGPPVVINDKLYRYYNDVKKQSSPDKHDVWDDLIRYVYMVLLEPESLQTPQMVD